MSLDAKLYAVARRLAAEQQASVLWEESDSADPCAAAADAGKGRQVEAPLPMPLGKRLELMWDGDVYQSYEIKLQLPFDALELIVKVRTASTATAAAPASLAVRCTAEKPLSLWDQLGISVPLNTHLPTRNLRLRQAKNVIGSAPVKVKVLMSHRLPQPSFGEHTFRYSFESQPPHRRAAKFTLDADHLSVCCHDAMSQGGLSYRSDEPDAAAACLLRPFSLWVAFKGRSLAVAQLTIMATVSAGSTQAEATNSAT